VLVSGGFSFFTSRVAAACGFDSERANTLVDDGAALTGEVGQPILGREAKLAALNEESARIGAAPADAIAMGDGANDLAMIKAAGLGVAYKAKPIVAAETQARIEHTDLTAALFFQGYREDEIVGG
jgi:phosphoserine phosphatase